MQIQHGIVMGISQITAAIIVPSYDISAGFLNVHLPNPGSSFMNQTGRTVIQYWFIYGYNQHAFLIKHYLNSREMHLC